MAKINYPQITSELEQGLRAGRISAVARELGRLNHARVPRPFRLPLARIRRRSGCIALGLKLLAPLARAADRRLDDRATAEESAEYAVLLQVGGCINEALNILERPDMRGTPEALLFRSFCHFNRWEYEAAVPLLEKYAGEAPDPYAKLVGAVNLAAALAMSREHVKASAWIESFLPECERGGHLRLWANGHELRAQIHVQEGDFAAAEEDLKQAERILGMADIPDALFLQKWRAVIEVRRSGDLTAVERLRAEARRRRVWETFREADLIQLGGHFDGRVFERLIYGTPHAAYRARAQRELGVEAGSSHAEIGPADAPLFDMENASLDGEETMKPGCRTHGVLAALAKDLYRPLSVGGLFSELFPGEHFDIFSSPDRVHQAIHRARDWSLAAGLPISIREEKGRFHLEAERLRLRLPLKQEPVNWCAIQWRRLQEAAEAPFTAAQIRGRLGLTPAEYRRFIGWALEQKLLERAADGPHPVYLKAG